MKKKLVLVGLILSITALPIAACAQGTPAPAPAPAPATITAPAPSPGTVTAPAPAPKTVIAPAPATVTLRAVNGSNPASAFYTSWRWYMNRVAELSDGNLTIDLLGGPSVMPGRDQGEAVANGIFDMTVGLGAWIAKLVPHFDFVYSRRISVGEMHSRGAFDLLRKESAAVGWYYIGMPGYAIDNSYYYSTSSKVSTPSQLKGQRVATFSLLKPFFEDLGMTVLLLSPADKYSAIERGLADGNGAPLSGLHKGGYSKLLAWWIDHGVFSSSQNIIMNLDKYNSLPKEHQDVLNQAMRDLEEADKTNMDKMESAVKKELIEGDGMTPIIFSPSDAKTYMDTAYQARLADLNEKYPDIADMMHELWGIPVK